MSYSLRSNIETALTRGDSLQPILDIVGIAKITRGMAESDPVIVKTYFERIATGFTDRREVVSPHQLFKSAFTNKKQATRFYETEFGKLVSGIAHAEFEHQKRLFVAENPQETDIFKDEWRIYILTGPNLNRHTYDFSTIKCRSLRDEFKYFMRFKLEQSNYHRVGCFAAIVTALQYIAENEPDIRFFADISEIQVRKLYLFLENEYISRYKSHLSVRSIHNSIHGCGKVVNYLMSIMRSEQLKSPIPIENHFDKYRFSNLTNMDRRTSAIPEWVVAGLEKHVDELSPGHQILYSIFVNTGLRLKEVVCLKEDCLQQSRYENLMLLRYIPYKTLYARRKRNLPDWNEILIPQFLSDEIQSHIESTKSFRAQYGYPYIFASKRKNHRPFLLCGEGLCDALNKIITKHGITDENGALWNITTRQFRKTIAIALIESGASAAELAYWLGHLWKKTSLQYYAEVREKRLAEMNTEFFRKKFDLLLSTEQLESFTEEQRRLLYVDFRLEQRRVELGYCVKVLADGGCTERNRLISCVNCKNLCTGRKYLVYWQALKDSQQQIVDALLGAYRKNDIHDYGNFNEYKVEKFLLDCYDKMILRIMADAAEGSNGK